MGHYGLWFVDNIQVHCVALSLRKVRDEWKIEMQRETSWNNNVTLIIFQIIQEGFSTVALIHLLYF